MSRRILLHATTLHKTFFFPFFPPPLFHSSHLPEACLCPHPHSRSRTLSSGSPLYRCVHFPLTHSLPGHRTKSGTIYCMCIDLKSQLSLALVPRQVGVFPLLNAHLSSPSGHAACSTTSASFWCCEALLWFGPVILIISLINLGIQQPQAVTIWHLRLRLIFRWVGRNGRWCLDIMMAGLASVITDPVFILPSW